MGISVAVDEEAEREPVPANFRAPSIEDIQAGIFEEQMRHYDDLTMVEVGKRLRKLRVMILKLNRQIDFAAPLGVSRGAVANWEVGKGISRTNLYRIGQVHNVSVGWLVSGRGRPQPKDGAHIDDLNSLIEQSALSPEEKKQFIEEVKTLLALRASYVHGRR